MRNTCVLVVLLTHLCYCKEYLVAYRYVDPSEAIADANMTEWRHGCLDMYSHTRSYYIPMFLLTGILLAVLAVMPIRGEYLTQELKKED